MFSHPFYYLLIPRISSLLLPFFLMTLGLLLLFKTEWMLDFTKWFERRMGARWIPTDKTARFYRMGGAIFLALGSSCLGYIWGIK